MKYLVTGGCGFIGSNLVDKLIDQGHDVNVIDNLSSDAHEEFYFNEHASYNHYNVTDYTMTRKMYQNVDTVFHIAAEARIQNCIEDPLRAFESNIMGLSTVLELAKKERVRQVIFSSTSAIYGLKNEAPMHESMAPDCLNPYSLSKLQGEEICRMYSKLYGLKTFCFRYFNVFGNRQPIKGQYAPVIGIFMRQKQNGQALTIVGDGEQRRDFVNVSDVVDANILIANSDIEKTGQVANVGTGINYSVNEIAQMISGKTKYLDPRIGEARVTLADATYLRSLGWSPKIDVKTWIMQELIKRNLVNI